MDLRDPNGPGFFLLKTIAFNAGKKPSNPIIGVSIENFIANIHLYALSWPKLNFGCYLTFEIIFFNLYFNGKTDKKNFGLLNFVYP